MRDFAAGNTVQGMKTVEVYTDGACRGNPGPGGYGVVLIYGAHRKELSAGFRWTTNNRMELTALIKALLALQEPCRAEIVSDSKYLLDALQKRMDSKMEAERLENGFQAASAKPGSLARIGSPVGHARTALPVGERPWPDSRE